MKIVIDARLYGLENAGLGRYTMNLVENLTQLDKKNSYAIILRESYYKSLSFPENWTKVLGEFRHYSIREQTELPKILKQINGDIVHFPHFNVPIRYSGKFVVTIHDLLMHSFKGKDATTLNPFYYRIKRVGYKKVFGVAVTKSRAVIVPSNFVKNDLLKKYHVPAQKIHVTHEGVTVNAKKITNSASVLRKYDIDTPFFFYVGNAFPHKNLERTIEACKRLNEEEETATLVIATSRGVFRERLSKFISSIKAGKCVKLLGYVPEEDLPVLYNESVGLLYPSLIEGFGLQGLEAMAYGTLVIVSDIDVFREIYKDNAIYFNPYDFSCIEKAMKHTLSINPSTRSAIIRKGKAFANKYSWKKMTEETIAVYESAVKGT